LQTQSRAGRASAASRGGVPARLYSVVGLALALAIGLWGYRAWSVKEVHIAVGDEAALTVQTTARSVQAVLEEAGIGIFEGDEVSPPLSATLREGERIQITRAKSAWVNVDGNR